MVKILLRGRPGIGKTTIIKKFVSAFAERVVGFWTEEMRDPVTKKRRGFTLFTSDGISANFAALGLSSSYRVGRYGVDIKLFEDIVIPMLKGSFTDEGKIIVVDEIGKMELFSSDFAKIVMDIIFEKKNPFLGTIPIFDVHPLLSKIRNFSGVKVIDVSEETRDKVLEQIIGLFKAQNVL